MDMYEGYKWGNSTILITVKVVNSENSSMWAERSMSSHGPERVIRDLSDVGSMVNGMVKEAAGDLYLKKYAAYTKKQEAYLKEAKGYK